jgi:hypothetical protein
MSWLWLYSFALTFSDCMPASQLRLFCNVSGACTGHTQKNGAVSKVNKKFVSHITRAQHTPSAAETVQVYHVVPAVRISCFCVAAGPVLKMALQQQKAFCVLRFEVSRSVITVQRDFFLWGFVKDSVYVPPLPTAIHEIRDRITHALQAITADMLHWVWDEFDYRVDVCRVTHGAHIEGL